jgi:hypothetical protein
MKQDKKHDIETIPAGMLSDFIHYLTGGKGLAEGAQEPEKEPVCCAKEKKTSVKKTRSKKPKAGKQRPSS